MLQFFPDWVLESKEPMDFEKVEEIPILSELPASVRNLFYQSFKFQPLRQIGSGYYRLASKKIASGLQNSIPSAKVFLLNPYENSVALGAYDLDFLAVKEKEFKEKTIWELRADYFHLKRRFPILGRVLLTQTQFLKSLSHSDCAASVVFVRRKRYQDGKWKSKKEWEKPIVNPLSRLALSISSFDKAQQYLIKSYRSRSSFYRARFYEEIHQSLYLSSGEKLGSSDLQTPALLLAHAFFHIQELAKKVSVPKIDKRTNFRFNFDTKSGARFSAEMLNRSWLDRLKKMDSGFASFRATPASLMLSCSTDLGLISVVNLFSGLVNFLPSLAEEVEELPLLLPDKAFEAMAQGWHWSKPLAHLSWAYPAQAENEEWLKACSEGTLFRLRERIFLETNLILGRLVSHSPEAVQKELRKLTAQILLLKSQENLPEAILRKQMRNVLPNTVEANEWVSRDREIVNLKSLVPLTLQVLKEAPLILENLR